MLPECEKYAAENVKHAKVHYRQRLGGNKQGSVYRCTVTFNDNTTREMAVKEVKKGEFAEPEDVHEWKKTFDELREANLPVPRYSFARVVRRKDEKIGQLFMQLLKPEKIIEAKGWGLEGFTFRKLRLLTMAEHAKLVQNLATDLAKLHNLQCPADIHDFLHLTTHEGRITGRLILDVGLLARFTDDKVFQEEAKDSLAKYFHEFRDREARTAFLKTYAEHAEHEELKKYAASAFQGRY